MNAQSQIECIVDCPLMHYREIVGINKKGRRGRERNHQTTKAFDHCLGVVGAESLLCLLLPNDVAHLRVKEVGCDEIE